MYRQISLLKGNTCSLDVIIIKGLFIWLASDWVGCVFKFDRAADDGVQVRATVFGRVFVRVFHKTHQVQKTHSTAGDLKR